MINLLGVIDEHFG